MTEDEYNSQEFQDFAGMFKPDISIAEIYKQYSKTKPKKDVKPMGSMKHQPTKDTEVKEYYSFEEAKEFSKEDFDKNPALYEAVKNSMLKWK